MTSATPARVDPATHAGAAADTAADANVASGTDTGADADADAAAETGAGAVAVAVPPQPQTQLQVQPQTQMQTETQTETQTQPCCFPGCDEKNPGVSLITQSHNKTNNASPLKTLGKIRSECTLRLSARTKAGLTDAPKRTVIRGNKHSACSDSDANLE